MYFIDKLVPSMHTYAYVYTVSGNIARIAAILPELLQYCKKLLCMRNPVLPQHCGNIARTCCCNIARNYFACEIQYCRNVAAILRQYCRNCYQKACISISNKQKVTLVFIYPIGNFFCGYRSAVPLSICILLNTHHACHYIFLYFTHILFAIDS